MDNEVSGKSVDELIQMLSMKNGIQCKYARQALEKKGKEAVQPLIEAVRAHRTDDQKWEACKALVSINDEASVPLFVELLEDEDQDICWIAAEGLSKQGHHAWKPLLAALGEHGEKSVQLCRAAHHALKGQEKNEEGDPIAGVLKAIEVTEATKFVAEAALAAMKKLGYSK